MVGVTAAEVVHFVERRRAEVRHRDAHDSVTVWHLELHALIDTDRRRQTGWTGKLAAPADLPTHRRHGADGGEVGGTELVEGREGARRGSGAHRETLDRQRGTIDVTAEGLAGRLAVTHADLVGGIGRVGTQHGAVGADGDVVDELTVEHLGTRARDLEKRRGHAEKGEEA